MKTEKEILEKLETYKDELVNYELEYRFGKISAQDYYHNTMFIKGAIKTLKWILNNNKDDRGEDTMDIKAGMIIKYRNIIQASDKLGEVIEVNVVLDHKDKSLIGQKHYMVSELDRTLLNTRVEESEIVEVYEKVRSPWAE